MATQLNTTLKSKTLNKIHFLEGQLTSLDCYLPETYEYLMQELDLQRRNLAELEIEEHFTQIDETDEPSTNTPQIQIP
jgi:hypothetical protein